MIDHVACTVPVLDAVGLDHFFGELGFHQFDIPEDEPQFLYEMEHKQRWYSNGGECDVHVVENRKHVTHWGWGHICVHVGGEQFEALRKSRWLVRDNDTGRIWLQGPGAIRVEVRP